MDSTLAWIIVPLIVGFGWVFFTPIIMNLTEDR